jgi:hypothetical protein
VESYYIGLWSGKNNKNKEDKRMGNNLDTNNNYHSNRVSE